MERRHAFVLGVTLAALLWVAAAHSQDPITNLDQISAAFDQPGLDCPLAMPYEPNWLQPVDILFLDFTTLTNAVAVLTNYTAEIQNGVSVWRLRLIQGAETGEVVLKPSGADVELLRIDAPPNFVPFQAYNQVLRSYCLLFLGESPTSYEDLIAEGHAFLDPPRTVADMLVVSAADADAYCAYGTTLEASGMFTAMAEDEGGGGDVGIDALGGGPCSITNLFQGFSVTGIQQTTNHVTVLTWPSCAMFRYLVQSTDQLSTNTSWSAQSCTSYIWGQPNSTTWTDTTTDGANPITQRFYRVQRLVVNPIAAGAFHSLALRTDGLWAWGDNRFGRLGDSTTFERTIPVPISVPLCGSISNVVAVAAGSDYSVAADASGTVWAWGANGSGQLGNGADASDIEYTPVPIAGVSDVVNVAAGSYHTLALRADGSVFAWGNDTDGRLGIGRSGDSTNSPIRSLVPTQTVVVAIAAGSYHSVALDANANVWTWGNGGSGRLGNGGTTNFTVPTMLTTISNVIAIAGGYDHTVALTADKRVWTWGNTASGDLGRSGNNLVPGQVANLTGVVAIAGGYHFTLAATSNGTVYAWGDNSYGQLGTNGISSSTAPIRVAGISNAVLVSASLAVDDSADAVPGHCLAVTVDQGTNQYWAWGRGDFAQIGNGATTNQYVPARLRFCPVCTGCIQLGTNGTFTAPCTGPLKLYFNDDVWSDNDSSTWYTVTITYGSGQTLGQTNVPSLSPAGVVIGTVSNGVAYSYIATGFCSWNNGCGFDCEVDASGRDHSGILRDCDGNHGSTNGTGEIRSGFICPDAICYSLVGRIE